MSRPDAQGLLARPLLHLVERLLEPNLGVKTGENHAFSIFLASFRLISLDFYALWCSVLGVAEGGDHCGGLQRVAIN